MVLKHTLLTAASRWIRRGKTEDGQHVWRLAADSCYMDGVCSETGLLVPDTDEDSVAYGREVRVVLTVAHLIAAAPDMATVLEYYADQFCEGFCKDLPQAGTYQPEMDLDCSGCKARAALAKARGQS